MMMHKVLDLRDDIDKLYVSRKERGRICQMVDFAVPVDHRVKINESKKRDKYLDLARELKKLLNMKVSGIPIVIGVPRTIPKDW